MRPILPTLALLALAACSQPEPAPSETASADPAAVPSPVPAAQVAVVPDRFHGIWDAETGTCEPSSDMRTEIAERGITFYESHGAVTRVTVESPEVVTIDLAMQGEGESWTMRRRFTLSNGDRTLTPEAVGDEAFAPMPLKRCA